MIFQLFFTFPRQVSVSIPSVGFILPEVGLVICTADPVLFPPQVKK